MYSGASCGDALHRQTHAKGARPQPWTGPVPLIARNDNKGCEMLPLCSHAIHMRVEFPRKLEFLAPEVSAKDRKWSPILVSGPLVVILYASWACCSRSVSNLRLIETVLVSMRSD